MKFKVVRTSGRFSKPCENAYEETQEIHLPNSLITEKNWIVEINSLEELISFESSFSSPIIIENEPGDPYPIIKIYDDRTALIALEAEFKFKAGSRVSITDKSSIHFRQVGTIVSVYRESGIGWCRPYWVIFDHSPDILYVFNEDQLAVKENLK